MGDRDLIEVPVLGDDRQPVHDGTSELVEISAQAGVWGTVPELVA